MLTVARAHGKPLAILNRTKPVFYCVPAKRYEAMMGMIEDLQLIELIKSRAGDEEIEVDIDNYKLSFLKKAKKEWDKLNLKVQKQFKQKLAERLSNPHIMKDRITGLEECYKIKLRTSSYSIIYKVSEGKLIVQAITMGKLEIDTVYNLANPI